MKNLEKFWMEVKKADKPGFLTTTNDEKAIPCIGYQNYHYDEKAR
jgi:hypothetical protein